MCAERNTASTAVQRRHFVTEIPISVVNKVFLGEEKSKAASETGIGRLLANGWAEDKASLHAPPAKRMISLKYDCGDEQSLAYEAAQKSAECVYPPKAPHLATRSQNYLKIDDYEIDPLDALQQAIKTWWRELAEYGVSTNTRYTAEMKAAGNLKNYVNVSTTDQNNEKRE
ncbi:hypothetical protein ANCDUO_23916 [Ancylostoma duodenale]|uniref:SCP domain-containing protein n=1 Tax=Ancylostoma duodenale TaxID=51022 RepID=A0A0C2BQG6_9BILA|nr:hypothetical protein ANCDUO_23916 [Ancylostoma duodenale]